MDDFGDKITKVQRAGLSADLPSPAETWDKSKLYITEPFAKRGELDQGILRFTWLSLEARRARLRHRSARRHADRLLPGSFQDLHEDVRPDLPSAAPRIAAGMAAARDGALPRRKANDSRRWPQLLGAPTSPPSSRSRSVRCGPRC